MRAVAELIWLGGAWAALLPEHLVTGCGRAGFVPGAGVPGAVALGG